jgi:hypothetical protein
VICRHSAPGDEARALLEEGQAPRPFLDLLIARRLHADAVRFLAHLLPKREAVWWAASCAREAAGAEVAPAIEAALSKTESWVVDPGEENRRAAMAAAEAAEFGTPAGCAALAAFLSGGSLGPPEVAPIVPKDQLCAQAVSGAILLAAVVKEPDRAPEKLARFLERGLEVLEGTNRWDRPAPPGRPRR